MKRYIPVLLGIPFVGLILASILVMNNAPGTDKSGAVILAWYNTHQHVTDVSALLGTIGIVFGIAFFALVVNRMRELSPGLAIAAFGGALVFAVGGALSYGVDFAYTDTPAHGGIASIMAPATAQMLNYVNSDLSYAFTCIGLGVFLLAAGIWLWMSGTGPLAYIWAILTIIVGLAAVSVFLGFIAFIGIGVWVLIMAIAMTIRPGKEDKPPVTVKDPVTDSWSAL